MGAMQSMGLASVESVRAQHRESMHAFKLPSRAVFNIPCSWCQCWGLGMPGNGQDSCQETIKRCKHVMHTLTKQQKHPAPAERQAVSACREAPLINIKGLQYSRHSVHLRLLLLRADKAQS